MADRSDPAARSLPLAWRALLVLATLIVRVLGRWRVRVEGLEHVPADGGAVLAFNHHSYFDFVMVGWDVVRELRRPVRFLAKREMWNRAPGRLLMRVAGAVPVDRTDAGSRQGAYGAAIAALTRGELVAVAPEQSVSLSFELLPMRTGAARMAMGAGVPLVPVVGWGTQRFASKGNGVHWVPRLDVFVAYGEPLHPGPDDDPVAVTAELQRRMEQALRRLQEQYPVRPAPGDDWWQPASLGGSAPNHDDVVAEHLARFRERQRRLAEQEQEQRDAEAG